MHSQYTSFLTALIFVSINLFTNLPTSFAQDADQQFENQVAKVAEAAAESVVGIETIGGTGRVDGTKKSNGAGTGIVIDSDGLVLTAAYFLADNPSGIAATLSDGKRVPASVVAHDRSRNLVLLKLKTDQKLKSLPMIPRNELKVGQTVIAVGKGYDVSSVQVSTGVVSATDRIWGKAIQTDAKISPANYGGPLLDLRGQVCGILVPLSQQSDKVMGGTEWYDSGIGFAVPVDEVLKNLDTLKAGDDLKAGLLGVSFAGSDIYVDDCKIAFCSGSSPAGRAGIRPGDVIVSLDGNETERQAQLKHALGPLYAGQEIKVSVRRGEETLDLKATLVAELEPFQPVAIGVAIDQTDDGLKVRWVEPDSPAAEADIKVGDLIRKVSDVPVEKKADLALQIAATAVDKEISLVIERNADSKDLEVTTAKRSGTIPAFEEPSERVEDAKSFELTVAEAPNDCLVIKPTRSDDRKNRRKELRGQWLELGEANDDAQEADAPDQAPAILVWLLPAGQFDRKEIEQDWQDVCQNQNTILLAIGAADDAKWTPEEQAVVLRALTTLYKQTKFDRKRIVIGGSGNGGTMASIVCFSQPRNFQGLVLKEAEVSAQIPTIRTSPVAPMMVLVTEPTDEKRAAAQRESLTPVIKSKTPIEQVMRLTSERIIAWVNYVDRL